MSMRSRNYAQTWQEVYQRYANFFVKKGQGIELLGCASMNGSRGFLSSWAPDWSDWEETQDIQIGSKTTGRYGYAAAGATKQMI